MRWSDVECDPVTGRCQGTETITTTRADGTTVETASVYDCSEASVADLGFPVGEPECLLKFQQTRTCPPGGPCTINNRRNLGRDSTGRVIHYIQERATGCDPDAIIAEDGCEEGERSEWHCDPSGSPCTRTIRRGWRNTEDSFTTWSGEEICELIAPLTFQCRSVDRTTFFSTVLPSGEVERGSHHITCDQDTGMCRDSRSTFTCNDDLSRCSHSRTTHAGLCDARLVREGSCPDETSSTSSSSERYERTCMPDGSCARSGTVTEYQCEMGQRASLCPAQSTTSYTATEQCARADTSPERCTLLSSSSTTTYPDGRMEDETVTCDPTVPSCQIDQRTTNPDGSVGTQSWSCGPSESDDTAPYRNGTCLSLVEER